MIERKLKIGGELEDGIFLFGARQIGKGTFLREKNQKSLHLKIAPFVLTNVKYRLRYKFSTVFLPQKSQLKTQNWRLKTAKVPPLEENRVDFCRKLKFGKIRENSKIERFNVR